MMEKVAVEPTAERKTFSLRSVLLTSWACVATALLLLVLIGGAVYLVHVHTHCEDDADGMTKTGHYSMENYGEEDSEDMYMDENLRNQLIIRKNKDGAITAVADFDYNKKISAMYLTAADTCVLFAGGEMDWEKVWEADTETLPDEPEEEMYRVNTETSNRATDMSLVPRYMRPFCESKPIFWATRDQQAGKTEVDAVHREKRSKVRISVTVCIFWRIICVTVTIESKEK